MQTSHVAKSIKRWELGVTQSPKRKCSFLAVVTGTLTAPPGGLFAPPLWNFFFFFCWFAGFEQRRGLSPGNHTAPCLSQCQVVSGSSCLMWPRTALSLSAGEAALRRRKLFLQRLLHFFNSYCYSGHFPLSSTYLHRVNAAAAAVDSSVAPLHRINDAGAN